MDRVLPKVTPRFLTGPSSEIVRDAVGALAYSVPSSEVVRDDVGALTYSGPSSEVIRDDVGALTYSGPSSEVIRDAVGALAPSPHPVVDPHLRSSGMLWGPWPLPPIL
ncbi:hypothetical protein ACOMHN_034006 [Nucella lapillus]